MKSPEVKKISIVSNTHWDREFRGSFEKTRYKLLRMMDTVIDILEKDPEYHSFTLDGHTLVVDDYLEMRPENTERVKKLVREGRLVIGPYYTLAEQFSISHEAIVRNMVYGRKLMDKYGAKYPTVAYTPSSWGQTGQYPQILKDFGIDYMMFYRGISHDEAPAEYVWEAPDGTSLLASRFALYCRYNWYYQVHRAVTRHKVFDKTYTWGEYDDAPFRRADSNPGESINYDLKSPEITYDVNELEKSVKEMLEREDGHFTTPIFLAMNGHDISVAYPLESQVVKDTKRIFEGKYDVEHTDLEHFWKEAEEYLDRDKMVHLKGERRSYLKEGMWTYLFPSTISARGYMKRMDFKAYTSLVYMAEPLSALANSLVQDLHHDLYLDKGWRYLLENHTHDANGGGAPDEVCVDMDYRYRKAIDISDILAEDSMAAITSNLSPDGDEKDVVNLTVFNTLPFKRDIITELELKLPKGYEKFYIEGAEYEIVATDDLSSFADSIWEVPCILDTTQFKIVARFKNVPALGYKVFKICKGENKNSAPSIVNGNVLENSCLKVTVNDNGTVDVLKKSTGKLYRSLNYLMDQGETGNAWKHVYPENDTIFDSKNVKAEIKTLENNSLKGIVSVTYNFAVPKNCEKVQNTEKVELPVTVKYILDADADALKVELTVDNKAKDHWLRAAFPTDIKTEFSYSDSHYDIVRRDVHVPDSTGWVETAYGMQPLRTFAAVTDDNEGFAVLPKGLYEYEVFEDEVGTMALTLLRCCRTKIAVSEEKQTELDDIGIQCPGEHTLEYAIKFCDNNVAELTNCAAEYFAFVPAAVSGRGKGTLPKEYSLAEIDNRNIHVTAVKTADDKSGIVMRMYNPNENDEALSISTGFKAEEIAQCDLTEAKIAKLEADTNIPAKKIFTVNIK